MPMSRFEIRNVFSLGDSELYRAADKDDPEALLEGVAMAGLVGVLRQLGDLAEFAAEVFHNLHDEVMVTAARGHGLMARVRQLETDIPSMERAFLSQTDHSSFFYQAGVNWHPNLRTDTNLVTRVDLPRFVMDSYEDCRAPPRLFLLDKFDVAGAGACLKRYTDPSIFKVETSDMTIADAQRERKILKLKRKGPRWRNGETTEPSNAKLHQLFVEEHTENGVNKPLRRVKLKRRLNGFPLDSKTAESYMKKILKSPSPDHEVLQEVDVYPLPALMPATASSDENDSGREVFQVGPVSPDRVSVERDRSFHPSPDRKEILLNPSISEPAEATPDDHIGEVPNSYHHIVTGGTSSTFNGVTENVKAIDAENNSEGSLTGYESNVVASEGETYMDATSVMEPEVDTEPEHTMKNDLMTSHTKSQSSISDANEEHDSTWISDLQSSGDSLLSDEGNNSSRKMSGSSTSDSANRISSADTHKMEIVSSPSFQNDADKGFMVDQLAQSVVSRDGMNRHSSEFERQQDNLCMPTLGHLKSEVIETENKSKQQEYEEISSTSHHDEKKTNIVNDQPCYPFVSGLKFHSRGNSSGLSTGEHHVIEPNEASKQPEYDERVSMSYEDEEKTHEATDQALYPVISDYELCSRDNSAVQTAERYLVNEPKDEMVPCTSTVPDVIHPITDSSATSLDSLHKDESNQQDQYLVENEASTSDMFNVPSQSINDAPEMILTTSPIPGKSDDEVPKLLEKLACDYSDVPHNEDVIKPTASRENLLFELEGRDSNASTDAPSGFLEVSYGRKLNGSLLVSTQTVDSEESCSNGSAENLIRSENLMMLHLVNSPDRPQADVDADEDDVIFEQGRIGNQTSAREFLTSGEIVGLPGEVTTDCASHGEHAETSDAVERDEMNLHKSSTDAEVTGISGSTDLRPPNRPDSGERVPNVDTESTVCVLADDTFVDGYSNMDLEKVVEHVHDLEGSGPDEIENDESSLSISHQEFTGLMEEAVQIETAASDSEAVFCNSLNDGHPKLEVSDSVPVSLLDSETDTRGDFGDCITIWPILEPSGSGSEDEFSQQSGLQNDVPGAISCSVDYNSEVSKTKEKRELLPNEFDQELLHSNEISFELPSLLSISQQKLQDHSDQGEHNSSQVVSLTGWPNASSISELHSESNFDVDVPGYPKAPLSSIFSLNNLFNERNQISFTDLPPLPPLPPVQWRMGKSQQDLTPTEEGMIKHKELSPELVGPKNASTVDACSSPVNSSTDDVKTSPPTASAADENSFPHIASSTDDVKNFLLMALSDDVVTSPQTSSTTNNVETFPPTALAAGVSAHIGSSIDDNKNLSETASSDIVVTSPQSVSSSDDVKAFPLTEWLADVNSSLQIASTADDIKDVSLMETPNDVVASAEIASSSDDVKTFPPTASEADVNSRPKIASSTDDIKHLPEMVSSDDAVAFPQTVSSSDDVNKTFSPTASAADVNTSPQSVSSTVDIENFPLTPSSDDVSTSPRAASSSDDFKTFPPTASAADVNTSLQIASSTDYVKNFPLMVSSDDTVTSPQTVSSIEDVKTSPLIASVAEVNTLQQIASSTDDIKNLLLTVSSDNVVTSPPTASSYDDVVKTFPPTALAADVNTSPQIVLSTDDIKNSQLTTSSDDVVTSPETASSAEDAKMFPSIASPDNASTSPKVASSTDDLCSPLTASNNYVSLPLQEATQLLIQTVPMSELKEETTKSICSTREIKDMQQTAVIVPNIDKKQQQSSVLPKDMQQPAVIVRNIDEKQQQSSVLPPETEFTSPEEDDAFSHESHTVKMPRPRNPLFDEVAALKLRKVTDRDRPEIQKGDERDAFLEQIRNKSFHLKPTMASRPSIQHRTTNVRVAAILEKANAIRQALAGSDEDEDDW